MTIADLRAAGLAGRNQLVKILAGGEISKAVTVEAIAFSQAAQKAIEAAGGAVVKA